MNGDFLYVIDYYNEARLVPGVYNDTTRLCTLLNEHGVLSVRSAICDIGITPDYSIVRTGNEIMYKQIDGWPSGFGYDYVVYSLKDFYAVIIEDNGRKYFNNRFSVGSNDHEFDLPIVSAHVVPKSYAKIAEAMSFANVIDVKIVPGWGDGTMAALISHRLTANRVAAVVAGINYAAGEYMPESLCQEISFVRNNREFIVMLGYDGVNYFKVEIRHSFEKGWRRKATAYARANDSEVDFGVFKNSFNQNFSLFADSGFYEIPEADAIRLYEEID